MRHVTIQENSKGEYAVFEDSLKKILSVSHAEIKSRIARDKRSKSKKRSASRASNAKP